MSEGGKVRVKQFAQPRLSLRGRAASPEAKALVDHCLADIVLPTLPDQQRRPTSIPAIEAATEGMLAGLIVAKDRSGGWLRRPLSASSFTAEPVSRGQFLKALGAFEGAGLIEREMGHFDRNGPVAWGTETRLRLTDKGKGLAESFGVTEPLERHFSFPGTTAEDWPSA